MEAQAVKNAVQGAIREHLMRAASERRVLTYQEAANTIGLSMGNRHHASIVASLLCDIAQAEDEAKRPLLSVIVVAKQTGTPGKGFFGFAKKLGKDCQDHAAYFVAERNAVWDYWSAGDHR